MYDKVRLYHTREIMEENKKPYEEKALDNESLKSVSGGSGPSPFPRKTKNNQRCPKCGERIKTAVGNYVDGMGLQMVTNCWDCDLHWISQDFYESEEITYTYVYGDFINGKSLQVIPKPF